MATHAFRENFTANQYPGKFEGEPDYTEYFWEMVLDGRADEDYDLSGEPYWYVSICAVDAAIFPELNINDVFVLMESEQGFVCHAIYSLDAFRNYQNQCRDLGAKE